MKKVLNLFMAAATLCVMTSCYDEYINDYEEPAIYFATQQPIRTLVADRDLTITIGATVGGIRAVDTSDWAKFEIDETLLDGDDAVTMGLELLPETHYTLADESMMYISNVTLPIVDVEISFTEAFFEDPKSVELCYALPFKLVECSRDTILESMSTSIVAIKYVSTYSGTFYVEGQIRNTASDASEVWAEYIESALNNNLTCEMESVDRKNLTKSSLTISSDISSLSIDTGVVNIEFNSDDEATVTLSAATGNTTFQSGSGNYWYEVVESYERLVVDIEYYVKVSGVEYRINEKLIRQEDPYDALEWEIWEATTATE